LCACVPTLAPYKVYTINHHSHNYFLSSLACAPRRLLGDVRLIFGFARNNSKPLFQDVRICTNQDGRTCLHFAIDSGNVDVVKYLIEEHNADVNIEDKVSMSILQLSVLFRLRACVHTLILHEVHRFPPCTRATICAFSYIRALVCAVVPFHTHAWNATCKL
jgi:ankyrin repeat protein